MWKVLAIAGVGCALFGLLALLELLGSQLCIVPTASCLVHNDVAEQMTQGWFKVGASVVAAGALFVLAGRLKNRSGV